jgi:hypothetical protein
MGAKKHLFAANEDLHKPVKNSTENGACLTGHESSYIDFSNKNSCNYRYQAVEQGKSHKKIKSYLHSYNDRLTNIASSYSEIPTSAYNTKKGGLCPAYYVVSIPVPRKGDWDVGGPTQGDIKRKGTQDIKKGENFTRDTWPYWNNAHHLIPKGTLKSAITNEGSVVGALMEVGLLKAKYNINHKKNMLFLPMDKEVGKILDMPRHIQLKEGDDDRIKASCTNHSIYDKMVKEMKDGLGKIIREYRDIVRKSEKGKCEVPDFELDKRLLEDLSDELLNMILEWQGGRSLDSLSCIDEQ